MRWPWQRQVDLKRATLTMLDDCWVVGLPENVTQASAARIADSLRDSYPTFPSVMVFNFPIEVIDKRTKVKL